MVSLLLTVAIGIIPIPTPAPRTVAELAKQLRPSVVVITVRDREGKQAGVGAGFVLSADGLIATNAHVIGEGRVISVETDSGTTYPVQAIHAVDIVRDLAIVRIAAKDLRPLELLASDKIADGDPVVAMGNPHGLKRSVVSGVLSGKRERDGATMLQIAMPVEPGNSGGPLVDLRGRVVGLVSSKSLVTENLGFAVASEHLLPMLKDAKPIPLDIWVQLGRLDPDEWTMFGEGRWKSRNGKLRVENAGGGAMDRSTVYAVEAAPKLPYEVSVQVKLDDEAGAAGLVFRGVDGEKYFGFYPSNGKLRLTRFDGANVLTWKILYDQPSSAYKSGEWNTFKVRLTETGVRCFVNDVFVVESDDVSRTTGRFGVARFRQTEAEFRRLQVGANLTEPQTFAAKAEAAIPANRPLPSIGKLASGELRSVDLRARAEELESRAKQLRELAEGLHVERTTAAILAAIQADDRLLAALLLAALDDEELNVAGYQKTFDRLSAKLVKSFSANADLATKQKALHTFFFDSMAFRGSRSDYTNKANSYLSSVIDDREGLPITLSLLYMEFGKKIGVAVEGIGLPGHFVVRDGDYIDVFDHGKRFDRAEALRRIGEADDDAIALFLKPMTTAAMVNRMLHNLLGNARSRGDAPAMLRYLSVILRIDASAVPDRLTRAGIYYRLGRKQEALADVRYLIDHTADEMAKLQYQELLDRIQQDTR